MTTREILQSEPQSPWLRRRPRRRDGARSTPHSSPARGKFYSLLPQPLEKLLLKLN